MSGLSKKRGREEAEEIAAVKRCRETEQILHLLEEEIDSEGRNEAEIGGGAALSEELLCGVMRSLEEEIGVSCSTSYAGSDSSGALSRDGSVVSAMTGGCGVGAADGVDIDYLLGASDDELGILPSSVADLGDESGVRNPLQFEGATIPLEFENDPELRGFGSDNWQFEDDLVDYRQFGYFEDVAANAALDVNHDAFIDAVWRLEAAGGMY